MDDKSSKMELIFPNPVHVSWASAVKEFDQIQNDFQRTYYDLVEKNKFNSKFGGNTVLISDGDFDQNLLDKYRLNTFKSFLSQSLEDFLKQLGFPEIPAYRITASWMTLNKPGLFSPPHTHAYSDLSGVYYFRTTGDDGALYFENPNPLQIAGLITHMIDDKLYFTPEEGKLLLFPGWLRHGVDFNTTDSDRVSISFNIVFNRI
jgi:hypothetical protein